MSDELKAMIERRKDHKARLNSEILVLQRVEGFVDGLTDVLPDVDVTLAFPQDGAISISIFVGSDEPRVECSLDPSVRSISDIGKDGVVPGSVYAAPTTEDVPNDQPDAETVGFEQCPEQDQPSDPDGIQGPQGVRYKTGEWSDEDMARALELDAEGKSAGEIGKAIGRRANVVGIKLKALRKESSGGAVGAVAPERGGDGGASSSLSDSVTTNEGKGEGDVRDTAAAPVSETCRPMGMPLSSDPPTHGALIPLAETKLARDYPQSVWIGHVMAVRKASTGGPWSQEADLILVEALTAGDGSGGAVEKLGEEFDREMVIARWKELCPQVTINNQARLLNALRGLS